jgi:hypothetical protein
MSSEMWSDNSRIEIRDVTVSITLDFIAGLLLVETESSYSAYE